MRRFSRFFLLGCTLTSACLWSKFSDFKKDTPVYAFTNKSFGALVGISYSPSDNSAFLGNGGHPGEGARFYALGQGHDDPSGDPLNSNPYCELKSDQIIAGRPCLSATNIVGVGPLTDDRTHPNCFAVGYGKSTDDPTVVGGPLAFCPDGRVFTMGDLPKDTSPILTKAFADRDEPTMRAIHVSFATIAPKAAGPNAPLLFGDEADNAAYFYPEITAASKPVLVGRPLKANHFGASVAMGTAAGMFFAVGAPSDGHVYVYEPDPDKTKPAVHFGCAGDGVAPSGDVIATGDVDGRGADDLLVAQGSGASRVVQVYLGEDRPKTALTDDCSASWAPSSMVLRCEETGGASGCATADFARSIAVGDLDGDGAAEVAVGAPGASAEGQGGSGVVFLYTPSKSNAVADVRYLGKPEGGAAFGATVTIGRVGTQDTLAAAAAGKGAAYVLWCTNLPGAPTGPRCRR